MYHWPTYPVQLGQVSWWTNTTSKAPVSFERENALRVRIKPVFISNVWNFHIFIKIKSTAYQTNVMFPFIVNWVEHAPALGYILIRESCNILHFCNTFRRIRKSQQEIRKRSFFMDVPDCICPFKFLVSIFNIVIYITQFLFLAHVLEKLMKKHRLNSFNGLMHSNWLDDCTFLLWSNIGQGPQLCLLSKKRNPRN